RLETSASAARAVKARAELTAGREHTSLSQNDCTRRRHRRHIADHAHHLAESGMTDVVPSPDGGCERTRSGHGPERTLRPSPLDYGNIGRGPLKPPAAPARADRMHPGYAPCDSDLRLSHSSPSEVLEWFVHTRDARSQRRFAVADSGGA